MPDSISSIPIQVIVLFCSDGTGLVRSRTDMRSANQSPQSVGSSGMDSGVDSFSDQSGELPSVAMSLCGGLTENRDITQGKEVLLYGI